MPDVRSLRIPLKYLANLLTAGDEEPVALGLERMLAMRAYMRAKTIDGVIDETIAKRVGLTGPQIEDMYQIMAIANYEDRFVIPTAHRELDEDAYDLRGSCGFSFGNGCSDGRTETSLFGTPRSAPRPRWRSCDDARRFKVLSALLTYPTAELQAAVPEIARGARRGRRCLPQRNRAPARSHLLERDRDRRSLRPAGALCAAVRPHALAVAAPVRACARREPRPRPGDGRPQGALRAARACA